MIPVDRLEILSTFKHPVNGTVLYYEYNGFNELNRIIDEDGHVFKGFENHYNQLQHNNLWV